LGRASSDDPARARDRGAREGDDGLDAARRRWRAREAEMDRRSVLVVYYSRTGHTRVLAEGIARALGADLEEIRDRTDRCGVAGYLRSGLEALLGASAEIERPRHDPGRYGLVVVGGPVWNASVSTPVRTYLWLERDRLPAVAFFASFGSVGADRALARMAAIGRRRPVATLAVRELETAAGVPRERIKAFAAAVRRRLERRRARRVGRVRAAA
jgi:menaquinone-dependent protoporphyrinogen IX oxidase